jgi:SAM-dependent methyltransferase
MIVFRWLGRHRQSRPSTTWEPTPPVSRMMDGRRYLTEQPYALPKDNQEEQRLTFQHRALYAYLHRHYFAPLQISAVHTILDVGCGPGAWLRDMALLFPHAQLVGLDSDSEQLPRAAALSPPSCRFVQGDILQGLPFPENSFDYTHMRCMVAAVPVKYWVPVIAELARITSPGGYLELFEGGQACEHAGPCMQQLLTWGQIVGKQTGFDLLVIERLSVLLRQTGLRHVREQRFNVPIGVWGGRAGELMALDLQAIFQALKALLCNRVPVAPEQFDAIVGALPSEWEQYHTSYTYIMTYAQKGKPQ